MHIKYRANTFDEFIGNHAIVESIKKQYIDKHNNTPLMFVGNMGSGKTSLAKIVSTYFTKNIQENIFEINCGDKRKIDDAREIIGLLSKTSIFGKYKVIILDEVHKLNEHAQSAWLTELEQLPNNVLVIACTTSTDNLLATFLRRFVQFKVAPLSIEECKELINKVCERANIKIPTWLKAMLIEKSNCVPGLILSNLSKVIDVTDEKTAESLLNTLSVEASDTVLDLFKLILAKADWNTIKYSLSKILKNEDPEEIRIGLMNIIYGRMMSDYMKYGEELKLIQMMNILKNATCIPYKATLVSAILEISLIIKDN